MSIYLHDPILLNTLTLPMMSPRVSWGASSMLPSRSKLAFDFFVGGSLSSSDEASSSTLESPDNRVDDLVVRDGLAGRLEEGLEVLDWLPDWVVVVVSTSLAASSYSESVVDGWASGWETRHWDA